MDKSKARRIVNREILPLMARLGIKHWKIAVEYLAGKPDENGWNTTGLCFLNVDYDKALIRLNHEYFDDEDELLKTLRHELLHVVSSPEEIAYSLVRETLKDEPGKLAVIERAFFHASEKMVINLERMFDCLTDPKLGKRKK